MSYPSLLVHLEKSGATLESANEAQLKKAYLEAFHEDLPFGFARVEELVKKMRANQGKAIIRLDPHSEEGKQFSRLLGADIAREVLADHFNCAFGFYNCCGGVAAPDKEKLNLSLAEQALFQSPGFVDC